MLKNSASFVLASLLRTVKRETRVSLGAAAEAWGKARLGAPGLGG
jgi:hypothetical protein